MTVGPLIHARATEIVARVASRYPPGVYARVGHWDEDALEDVAQDVLAELLDGHLATIFDYARTIAGFDHSVVEVVRDVLSARRKRTVIDNLIDRSRKLVAGEPFLTDGEGSSLHFGLAGIGPSQGDLSDRSGSRSTDCCTPADSGAND